MDIPQPIARAMKLRDLLRHSADDITKDRTERIKLYNYGNLIDRYYCDKYKSGQSIVEVLLTLIDQGYTEVSSHYVKNLENGGRIDLKRVYIAGLCVALIAGVRLEELEK